jgi:hypothetical protein
LHPSETTHYSLLESTKNQSDYIGRSSELRRGVRFLLSLAGYIFQERYIVTAGDISEGDTMDELINALSQKTGLPEDKARVAVETVVNYLKSKLPESAAGHLDTALSGESGGIAERISGIFGKKSA